MTINGGSAYAGLERTFQRIAALDDTLGILDWDQATVMPEGSAAARADQIAALSVLRHELLTAPAVGEALDAASGELPAPAGDDIDWRQANLRQMRRAYVHATAVPGDLVEARARHQIERRRDDAFGAKRDQVALPIEPLQLPDAEPDQHRQQRNHRQRRPEGRTEPHPGR